MNNETQLDRAKGVLLGLSAGDRIGGLINLSVLLAESLIECRNFDNKHIGNTYFNWYKNGGFDMGYVSLLVFRYVDNGYSLEDAVNKVDIELDGLTAGCNPAHRISSLAMASFIKDDQLAKYAIQEALITHKHPLAGDVSAATVLLCRKLIRGYSWDEAKEFASIGRMLPTKQASLHASENNISKLGYSPDVFETAIYFLNTSSTFEDALERSVEFAGGANYCPVLVGAIGGARWGASAIAPRFDRLGINERVNSVTEKLIG